MKKIFFYSIILLLFPFLSFGQNDWRSGYIIRSEGDTIQGFIDYRSFKKNSRYCFFRINNGGEKIKFAPGDIAGYRINDGRFYVSKTIKTDSSEEKVFLEFLVEGKANLYFLDGEKERYFIEKDGTILELKNTVELTQIKGINYEHNSNEFKHLLNYVFADARIEDEIQSTILQQNSLIKVTKNYHEKVCKDYQCILYNKTLNKTRIDFGVVYGVNLTLFNINSVSFFNRAFKTDFTTGSNSYAGLTFTFHNMPLVHERFSFNLEMLATKCLYSSDSEVPKERYYLKIPLTIQYKILTGKIYPVAEIGLIDNVISYNHQYFLFTAGARVNFDYYRTFGTYIGGRFDDNLKRLSIFGGLYF